MQAKKRYVAMLLVFVFAAIVRLFCWRSSSRCLKQSPLLFTTAGLPSPSDDSFVAVRDVLDEKLEDEEDEDQTIVDLSKTMQRNASSRCVLTACFNFSRCTGPFKVFLYPDMQHVPVPSHSYEKILRVIRQSHFYTTKSAEACVFVLTFDTLDRDYLSPDFVRNVHKKINNLPVDLWNGGANHVIFNLYSGTWPDYDLTHLGFDPGMAILAKASFSVRHFRSNFDISLPLFHRILPVRSANASPSSTNGGAFPMTLPNRDGYTLVFKGKRYVVGIGSETRNSLHHLHNEKDIIMLTTCKHGKDWQRNRDERCDADNHMYDRWTYENLMGNSNFCLVPRGRRLGSFRFLEALEKGCIPVILSNEWVLPFSEIIDWKEAVIWADERTLFQLPEVLRSIPLSRIVEMRQQGRRLYELYFGSVERIVMTVFEIIQERLYYWRTRSAFIWNSGTGGGLFHVTSFSDSDARFPFYSAAPTSVFNVAAVVSVSEASDDTYVSRVRRLIRHLVMSAYVQKIVVVCQKEQFRSVKEFVKSVQVPVVVRIFRKSDPLFFLDLTEDAVIHLHYRCALTTGEIDFAIDVWRWFPDRMVGYYSWNHVWLQQSQSWSLTSKVANEYSMISGAAVIFHRYYLYLFHKYFTVRVTDSSFDVANCWDVLLNFVISEITRMPPVKLEARTLFCENCTTSQMNMFRTKQKCFKEVAKDYDSVPLLKSFIRFDDLSEIGARKMMPTPLSADNHALPSDNS